MGSSNKQEYDSASMGSSALLASLGRDPAVELSHRLGYCFAAIVDGSENILLR